MLYRAAAARRLAARASPAVRASLPSNAPLTHEILAARLARVLRISSPARTYATTRSSGTQTGRKPAARKTGTAAKKPAAKAKKPAKKAAKKPKKKPVVKKRRVVKKKPLDPVAVLKNKVKALKAEALLDEPKYDPTSAWLLTADRRTGVDIAEASKARSARYNNMSAGERQALQTQADANRRSNDTLRKQFIAKHTPYEVYRANLARAALTRIRKGPVPEGRKQSLVGRTKHSPLPDPRIPKRPLTGYMRFAEERRGAGELTGSGIAAQAKEATQQWNSLSPTEKKVRSAKTVF